MRQFQRRVPETYQTAFMYYAYEFPRGVFEELVIKQSLFKLLT